jgi:5-methylcytosine-specific restriction endonuclease McrA
VTTTESSRRSKPVISVEVKECGKCGARDRYPSGPCRPCTDRRNRAALQRKAAWARANRKANPDAVRAKERENRKRLGPAKVREYNQRYAKRNPGYWSVWRANNPDKVSRRNDAWIARHPGRAAELGRIRYAANPADAALRQRRRRARRLGAEGTHTVADVVARFAYFGNRCWMCGEGAEVIDHVKSLCNGGSNWPSNLRPACRRCNARKGAIERHRKLPLAYFSIVKQRSLR